jgi:hypothetical protein
MQICFLDRHSYRLSPTDELNASEPLVTNRASIAFTGPTRDARFSELGVPAAEPSADLNVVATD